MDEFLFDNEDADLQTLFEGDLKDGFIERDAEQESESDVVLNEGNDVVLKEGSALNDLFNDDNEIEESEEVITEEEEQQEEEQPETKKKETIKGTKKNQENDEVVEQDVVTFLKGQGLIDVADDEEIPDDLGGFLLEKVNDKIKAKVKESISGLSAYTRNLISYEINGGKPEDFIKKNEVGNVYDVSTKEGQAMFLYDYYKKKDLEEDEIATQIKSLHKEGKLQEVAEKGYAKYLKEEETRLKNAEKELNERNEKAKKYSLEYKNKLEEIIDGGKPLGQLKINKLEKEDYINYINTPVKHEDGETSTTLYRDLQEIIKNPRTMLQLVTLLKNRDKEGNFDFSFMEKQIETKVTKMIKTKLDNSSKAKPRSIEDNVSDITLEEWAKTLK